MEEEIRTPGEDERPSFRRGKKGRKPFKSKGRAPRSGNDYSYWNKYSELMDVATRIPWMYIPGTNVKIPEFAGTVKFSNVMVLEYLSTPGINIASTDPFNLQIRKTWLDMHRKYRGLGAYEQADLGIILFCVKEVFAGLGECGRIYGIYSSYPVGSRILPRGILRALGYNASLLQSIETNLADYLYGVNRLVRKARQLCLPKNLSVLRNQLGLTSFLYSDSKDKRASVYAFKPCGYWKYEASAISTGSAAHLARLTRSDTVAYPTYKEFLAYFENLIDTLLNDSDVTRVCSDLIAAYGEEGTEALVPFEVGHAVSPLYDESILHKIHNSEQFNWYNSTEGFDYQSVMPVGPDPLNSLVKQANTAYAMQRGSVGNFWIVQDNNVVFFKPAMFMNKVSTAYEEVYVDSAVGTGLKTMVSTGVNLLLSGAVAGGVHALDTWKETPDAADVCEGCLWKFAAQAAANPTSGGGLVCGMVATTCSTELILNVYSCKVVNSDFVGQVSIPSCCVEGIVGTQLVRAFVHFDWHPLIPVFNADIGSDASHYRDLSDFFGDIDNFTLISDDVIMKIHDAAMLSAFAIDATVSK